MTKAEILTFIEEMGSIGDDWTEEQVQNVYGSSSLAEALEDRKTSVTMHLNALATAAQYLSMKEDTE